MPGLFSAEVALAVSNRDHNMNRKSQMTFWCRSAKRSVDDTDADNAYDDTITDADQ